MSPFLAELLGTMLLILMGGGVVANVCLSKTKGNGAGWIAITTAWALGVFIGVVVAGPYSGCMYLYSRANDRCRFGRFIGLAGL